MPDRIQPLLHACTGTPDEVLDDVREYVIEHLGMLILALVNRYVSLEVLVDLTRCLARSPAARRWSGHQDESAAGHGSDSRHVQHDGGRHQRRRGRLRLRRGGGVGSAGSGGLGGTDALGGGGGGGFFGGGGADPFDSYGSGGGGAGSSFVTAGAVNPQAAADTTGTPTVTITYTTPGPTGPTGPQGATGADGADGADGATGPQGPALDIATVGTERGIYRAEVDSQGQAWIQEERFIRAHNRWIALSNIPGYPSTRIASVSLAVAADRLRISLLAADNQLYEASCPVSRRPLSEDFLHHQCGRFIHITTRNP